MTIPKTKEEIITMLKEYDTKITLFRKFCEDNPYFVCPAITNDIHLTGKAFDKIVEILQPTVYYDPAWLVTDTHTAGCKSFKIDIDGNLIKVMAIWHYNVI